MKAGIYAYVDTKDDSIVYVGKDSNISEARRHKQHHMSSLYKAQKINQVLQNNPGRYQYIILENDVDNQDLNELEIAYIKKYNPFFNFTKGGDGARYWLGKKRSHKTKMKIGEANKKYSLWDTKKCHYDKGKMFKNNRDGSTPCRCFRTKYNGKDIPIGLNIDFTTCEIINTLIDDACKK